MIRKSLLWLYYFLVYPYLSNYNVVWSSTYSMNIHRIYLSHKRTVRIICAAEIIQSPSKALFQKLDIFDIYSFLSFQIGSFMYLYHHEMLPVSFQNLFQTKSQIHNYCARYANSYRSHACRTKFTILYQGLKLWNSLPHSIIRLSNIRTF